MPDTFLIFQKFNDPALAEHIAEILAANGIEYIADKTPVVFDPSFRLRNEASDEYLIKIRGKDFERANEVLAAHEKSFVDEVDNNHYLFAFTDDELLELLAKRDEWSAFDVELAKKILADRGISITDAQDHQLQEKRIEDLKTNSHMVLPMWLMAVGYISAALGGLIGIGIGIHVNTSKTTLPNGELFYNYSPSDRAHGHNMIYIGIGSVIVILLARILSTNY